MDRRTVAAYNSNASEFCGRYNSLVPGHLRSRIVGFFHARGLTADIGCGSGRDVARMNEFGYRAIGYDASAGMLEQARSEFPDCEFVQDSLPQLAKIDSGTFANVLCNAVLMHVRREDVKTAVQNLARILRCGGRLLLSYRESRCDDEREEDGRLFTSFAPGEVPAVLESVGLRVLTTILEPDAERSDVSWTVILAEREAVPCR